jgi:ribosomal subunit interface protein
MQIQILSTHFEADRELLDLVTKKFKRFEKLYSRIERCNVILKHEKDSRNKKCVVEVRLAVPGKDIFASESGKTYEQAIEQLLDDLKKQVVKRKEKLLELMLIFIVENKA